jgi:hypothetical protein
MRMTAIMGAAVGLALALGGGCKSHDDLKVDVVCRALCECEQPGDEECLAECTDEIDPDVISEPCFECFLEEAGATCPRLEDACFQICDPD